MLGTDTDLMGFGYIAIIPPVSYRVSYVFELPSANVRLTCSQHVDVLTR